MVCSTDPFHTSSLLWLSFTQGTLHGALLWLSFLEAKHCSGRVLQHSVLTALQQLNALHHAQRRPSFSRAEHRAQRNSPQVTDFFPSPAKRTACPVQSMVLCVAAMPLTPMPRVQAAAGTCGWALATWFDDPCTNFKIMGSAIAVMMPFHIVALAVFIKLGVDLVYTRSDAGRRCAS